MYLKGSNLSLNRKRKPRPNIWRILFLLMLIAAGVYVNQVIVPTTPPLFIPTPTATREPESYVSEAENYLLQGKLQPAIQSYSNAIETNPKDISIYITIARLQVLTGSYEEATTSAENALLLSPDNSMAHAIRGWALGFTGDYLEAEAALKRALELDPNNAAAYAYNTELITRKYQEGQSDLGEIDEAIENSKLALELAPNLLETRWARGSILEATGNYEEAIVEFKTAIAINENIAELHLALGRNYRYTQDYASAVEEFSRANALNPADPLPDTYISRTYATVGEFAKAIQFAQQAVKDDPTDPLLQGNLGSMLYRNRQYAEALAPLKLAVRGGTTEDGEEVSALPLDYGRVAEYYFTYGLALARTGDCNEALQISQLLQQGVPDDETSVYNAQEMVAICQEFAESGIPSIEVTEEPEENIDTEVTETPESE